MFNTNKFLTYIRENGLQNVLERSWYESQKRLGIISRKNPDTWNSEFPISRSAWLQTNTKYLFVSKNSLTIPKDRAQTHQLNAQIILTGRRRYFNDSVFAESKTDRWFTHPVDHYVYDKNKHWTKYKELSPERDIKYIWENSRFCYLYDIIRYDYHFNKNYAAFVLGEMNSWIDENKFNKGPHFISSQEIGVRILNWLFAIYYYSKSELLTDELFKKILQSIYEQVAHIEANLSFSQKFVRNNHIITEATAIFVFSILFPQVNEAAVWLKKSKNILEKEIDYQIFEDGTYLQYSMNYHRTIIQLLTLNFTLAQNNNIIFDKKVYEKATLSLQFLISSCDTTNGKLPNYGANDGSLFFPLNNNNFSDFRPQLQALANSIGQTCFSETVYEDLYWYGITQNTTLLPELKAKQGSSVFKESGYYTYRDNNTFTFIRCGDHKYRPSQADMLHLDLWYKDLNFMRDGGTYLYNTDKTTIKYFAGTASHNTIMLDDFDQMLKGPRFIWIYKTKCLQAEIAETDTEFQFTGSILAFKHTGAWQHIKRTVSRSKTEMKWKITDELLTPGNFTVRQIWNPVSEFNSLFKISAIDQNNINIAPEYCKAYFSESYGTRTETEQIIFNTKTNKITTIISLR